MNSDAMTVLALNMVIYVIEHGYIFVQQNNFLKWLYQFILLPAMCESGSCSKVSPILGIVYLFHFGNSDNSIGYLFVVLLCVFCWFFFLMNLIGFLKCFLLNTPFCEMFVQVFCPFFFHWVVSFFSIYNSLCILNINHLLDICIVKTSHSVTCLSSLLLMSIME